MAKRVVVVFFSWHRLFFPYLVFSFIDFYVAVVFVLFVAPMERTTGLALRRWPSPRPIERDSIRAERMERAWNARRRAPKWRALVNCRPLLSFRLSLSLAR